MKHAKSFPTTSSPAVSSKKGHPVGHLPKTVHTSKLNKGGDLAFKGKK